MTRDEFAERVAAALRLQTVRERWDALEPLVGPSAGDWAKVSTPIDCASCGRTVPREYTVDGVCVTPCEPVDVPPAESWERDIPF